MKNLAKLISINLRPEYFDILAYPYRKVNKITLKPSTATKKTQKEKKNHGTILPYSALHFLTTYILLSPNKIQPAHIPPQNLRHNNPIPLL